MDVAHPAAETLCPESFFVGLCSFTSWTGNWVTFALFFLQCFSSSASYTEPFTRFTPSHSPSAPASPSRSLPSRNLCGCRDVDELPCDPLQLYTWHMQLSVGGLQPGRRCGPLNLKQALAERVDNETILSFHSYHKYAGSDRLLVGVQSCKETRFESQQE